jgi:hypothetical protein
VTLGGLQGEKQGTIKKPFRSRFEMNLRLEERVLGVGKWFPRLCTYKTVLDKPKQDQI